MILRRQRLKISAVGIRNGADDKGSIFGPNRRQYTLGLVIGANEC